jgi:flagellar basal body-associated protein FliL
MTMDTMAGTMRGVALVWILILVVLVLGIVALVKYLKKKRRSLHHCVRAHLAAKRLNDRGSETRAPAISTRLFPTRFYSHPQLSAIFLEKGSR